MKKQHNNADECTASYGQSRQTCCQRALRFGACVAHQLFDGEKVLLGIDSRLRAELSEVQACLSVDLTNKVNHSTVTQRYKHDMSHCYKQKNTHPGFGDTLPTANSLIFFRCQKLPSDCARSNFLLEKLRADNYPIEKIQDRQRNDERLSSEDKDIRSIDAAARHTSPLAISSLSMASYLRKASDLFSGPASSWKPTLKSSSVQLCSASRSLCSANEMR